jgi:hypothetical protein
MGVFCDATRSLISGTMRAVVSPDSAGNASWREGKKRVTSKLARLKMAIGYEKRLERLFPLDGQRHPVTSAETKARDPSPQTTLFERVEQSR